MKKRNTRDYGKDHPRFADGGDVGGDKWAQMWKEHRENLARTGGKGIANADGSHSTLYASDAEREDNGKTIVYPTALAGRGRGGSDYLSDRDAYARTKVIGQDKYPNYDTSEDAMKDYMGEGGVHEAMEKDLSNDD